MEDTSQHDNKWIIKTFQIYSSKILRKLIPQNKICAYGEKVPCHSDEKVPFISVGVSGAVLFFL